jgi:pimeloyl-ACP methyl ester carboxylesterase
MMKRQLVDLPWGQMMTRCAGDGAPIALLHASPLSAAFLRPQIEALAPHFTAIGIDAPGYGQSDAPARLENLEDYADVILATMRALGHERFGLYGTATGAQIALALAKRAPSAISRLVLENCGHFDAELRTAWEDGYFPDITARLDGSHMTQIWDMCVKQATRFPWHLDGQANAPPPIAFLEAMARAYLECGADYHKAYRLAFHAEDAASFQGLGVPTILIDWESSVVRKEVHALIAKGLPACVRVAQAGAGLPARLDTIVAAFTAPEPATAP